MNENKKKYQLIVEDIRSKILNSEYKGGYKLPGQFDLAKQYQVSAITANRALNELRDLGFIERRERSGSYVLNSPRLLNHIYILVGGEYKNPVENLMPYWQTIRKLAEEKGITTEVVLVKDSSFIDNISSNKEGIGVIFLCYQEPNIIHELDNNSIPYVLLGVKSDKVKYNATEDRYGAAGELTRRLLNSGCNNIAFLGTLPFPNHHEAESGCLDTVNNAARKSNVKAYNVTEKNIGKKITSLLSSNVPPDGLIVMGGMLPFLALPKILSSKINLKMGFMTENETILELKEYAMIASYRQEETARLAFEMLLDVTAGKLPGKATRLTQFEIISPY